MLAVTGRILPVAVASWVCLTPIAAAAVIETVSVGNPGNAGELSGEEAGGYGPSRICGAVGYTYKLSKYEVTAGEYAQFLNKVAATDTYGLYNMNMGSDPLGCQIQRSGAVGAYTYSVAPDWANRPVNYVSYWDSCRFANWLQNGQPTGMQGPGTTEGGAYALNGYNGKDGRTIQRNAGCTWAVTSEDEWYKAAYHKNDGVTANYWAFPAGSNDIPDNGNPGGDTGNSANFFDGDDAIGSPYWRTTGGFFRLSDSPYGTFDQGGNVWEWNEAVVDEGPGYVHRGLRGGSFISYNTYLRATDRLYGSPTDEGAYIGFRVAEVPEPTTLGLLALGAAALLRRRPG
jgi:formylglycine-generating enzyme